MLLPVDATSMAWTAIERQPTITAEMADAALTDMEVFRSKSLCDHGPAAQRLAEIGSTIGRNDITMRARLIVADLDARHAHLARAATAMESAGLWAAETRSAAILARSHCLLSVVHYSIGDIVAAQRHSKRSIDELPGDAPAAIRIDHLVMLGLAHGRHDSANGYFSAARELAITTGHIGKAIGIESNVAHRCLAVGDAAAARQHVTTMRELAEHQGGTIPALALAVAARVYLQLGEYAEAVALLQPTVTDDPRDIPSSNAGVLYTDTSAPAECLLTLAHGHRMLGEFGPAQRAIDRARLICDAERLPATHARARRAQARLNAALGDYDGAYREHVAYHREASDVHLADETTRATIIQSTYDSDKQRRGTARFRELAMRDSLTGLYNRRFIDDQLTTLTTRAATSRTALSAAIVDADLFKRINDAISHEVGDQVLRILSAIIESTVVAPETAGRLGGEEFVILMPGIGAKDARERCEQVRVAIADHHWAPLTGSIPITVSIGVATATHGQTSPAALLSDADRHLYAAKRSGRNRVVGDDQHLIR